MQPNAKGQRGAACSDNPCEPVLFCVKRYINDNGNGMNQLHGPHCWPAFRKERRVWLIHQGCTGGERA